MELKKSRQADLQNKRLLFFEIGLFIPLLTVAILLSLGKNEIAHNPYILIAEQPIPEEIVQITLQDFRPPAPQKQQNINVAAEILQIVKNDTKITTEIGFDAFPNEILIAEASKNAGHLSEDVDFGDEIYITVEDEPKFMDKSWETFAYWAAKQIKYPKAAVKDNIQGLVKIRFVIEKDGSISNIEVLTSPSPLLSEEALRVIRMSPAQWTPGKQRDKPVRVRFEVPVDFKL